MKKLTLLMSALLIGVMAFAEAPKVTLDFSTEAAIQAWGLPSDYTFTDKTYTNGGYTITISPNTNTKNGGFKGATGTNGIYLMLRYTGSALQLPAFDFAVSKIVVYGRTGASTATKFNVFVGSTAVSDEVTSAAVTQTFMIASAYQAAGNVYKIQVTNTKNQQITKVEVYEAVAGAPANVDFNLEERAYITAQTLTLSCTTEGASIYYTTDGTEPTEESELYEGAIAIDHPMTVKAVAIKNSIPSSVITKNYIIVSAEGNGTKTNPFTVADALVLNNNYPDKQWVVGKIVGIFKDNVPVIVDGENPASDSTNIAITDGLDTIAIQLVAKTAARKNLNLFDNASLVGRYVKLHGDIVSYFQRAGLKNVDDYELVPEDSTALEEETATEQKDKKLIENGQVIIIRNGVRYSITGVELK